MLCIWVCWVICWLTCCSSIFNCSLSWAAMGRLWGSRTVRNLHNCFKSSQATNFHFHTSFSVIFLKPWTLSSSYVYYTDDRKKKCRPHRSLKCPWEEEAVWWEGYEAPPHPWLPYVYSAVGRDSNCNQKCFHDKLEGSNATDMSGDHVAKIQSKG